MAAEEVEVRTIRNVVAARATESTIYMVLVEYEESDAMNSVGVVMNEHRAPPGGYGGLLSTNDSITYLWKSPQGALWVASARGNVWTTAPVSWPNPNLPGYASNVLDPSFTWNMAPLPWYQLHGMAPIPESIWGTSDEDVHVTTFKGSIYHWDGAAWEERIPGPTEPLNDIHGLSADEAYAVGEEGTIVRYDGATWTPIPFPDDAGSGEGLTGVRVIGPDDVYICSRSGSILHGGRDGFEVVAAATQSLYGMGYFQGRLLIAAGDAGVVELVGNRVDVVKDNFASVGVFEEQDIVFFIEPNQEPVPSMIAFAPAETPPWTRHSFA
jgi:hypothetical protein